MAIIELEDGRRLEIEGEATPEAVESVLKEIGGSSGKKEVGTFSKIFDVPAASNREAIRANPLLAPFGPVANVAANLGLGGEQAQQAAIKGAVNPESSETFQNQFIRQSQNLGGPSTSVAVNFAKGLIPSAIGLQADIATNPAGVLSTMAVGAIGESISKTKVGKNFINFLQKKRSAGFGSEKDLLKASELAKKSIDQQRKVFTDPNTGKFSQEIAKIKDVNSSVIAGYLDDYVKDFPEGINVAKFNQISERLKKGNTVSGEEIKDIQNEISKTINWRLAKRDPQTALRVKVWSGIQNKLSELNPALKDVNKEYKLFSDKADDLYSVIIERGRPGSAKLKEKVGRTLFGNDKFSLRQKQAIDFIDNNALTPDTQFRYLIDKVRNTERLKRIMISVPGILGTKYLIDREINAQE